MQRQQRKQRRQHPALRGGIVAGLLCSMLLHVNATTVAADSNAGAGPLQGVVQFAVGRGVPGPGQPCGATSWSFTGTAVAAVVDLASSEYVGTVAITAAGGAACALSTAETGAVSVAATSTLPLGAFRCPPQPDGAPLSGTYLRAGTSVVVDVRGSCAVAGHGQGNVEFIATGEFAPTMTSAAPPAGQVTQAAFAGAFAVSPTS
jgi:hypothetical protein